MRKELFSKISMFATDGSPLGSNLNPAPMLQVTGPFRHDS
jgi:hypothetical protein